MRVALIIEYDGTAYCGWQVQPNGITVQEVIETAYFNLFNERISLVASGRTDSGVHALGQVAHFDTALSVPAQSFCFALNAVLPPDIRILKSFETAKDFHARYSAKRKKYAYSAYIDRFDRPLKDRYAVRISPGLDIEKVKRGATLLVGTHDFASFCSSGSSVKTTVRTIYDIDVKTNGNDIKIEVCGNGFLYNMVRIIVGTLFSLGYGKIGEDDIKSALEKNGRDLLGKTMPARGLTLVSVDYD